MRLIGLSIYPTICTMTVAGGKSHSRIAGSQLSVVLSEISSCTNCVITRIPVPWYLYSVSQLLSVYLLTPRFRLHNRIRAGRLVGWSSTHSCMSQLCALTLTFRYWSVAIIRHLGSDKYTSTHTMSSAEEVSMKRIKCVAPD